eukprot:TRINITY_DN65110_c0_g1_i2.p2 TRINITY_DN65110_c0_g1~~TRINITY_DN65110_c0_g1_i2.p2  ORF type:complete len:165 (-),score=1.81 TRINITY_DN65110_c0_g1_i2:57-551(-)
MGEKNLSFCVPRNGDDDRMSGECCLSLVLHLVRLCVLQGLNPHQSSHQDRTLRVCSFVFVELSYQSLCFAAVCLDCGSNRISPVPPADIMVPCWPMSPPEPGGAFFPSKAPKNLIPPPPPPAALLVGIARPRPNRLGLPTGFGFGFGFDIKKVQIKQEPLLYYF